MEAVERHHRAALQDHAERRAAERVHVEHRQRREHRFGAVPHRGFAALRDVPVGDAQEIVVREHAAFRLRRRAGREQQRARIVALARSGASRLRGNAAALSPGAMIAQRWNPPSSNSVCARQRDRKIRLGDRKLIGEIVGADPD